MSTVMVDCGRCDVRGLACSDCVISTLLVEGEAAPRFGADEQRALNTLADSGLLPPLRLVSSAPRVPGRRAVAARAG